MSCDGGSMTNSELAACLRKCLEQVEKQTGKVKQSGTKLRDSQALLRAYLADYSPEAKAARKALVCALECGVADSLRERGCDDPMERRRCISLLVSEQCLSEEWAECVVAIWVEALGGASCPPDAVTPLYTNGAGRSSGSRINYGSDLQARGVRMLSVLAGLPPRDGLRGLFAGFPSAVSDDALFSNLAKRLFANDAKRRTRYVAVQTSGIMARVVGKSSVDSREWEKIVRDLAESCGFSRDVAVECASEWAFALNVAYPGASGKVSPPRPVDLPAVPAQGHAGGHAGRVTCAGPSFSATQLPSVAGERLALLLPGNVAMEFVWCPPGTFTMGSSENELGRFDWESPLHDVTLTHGFWMARYPTTQQQYAAIIAGNPSRFKNESRPVETVKFSDAMEFCQNLNDRLSFSLPARYHCTLPTEAQWEYACRAGTSSALNSGRDLTKAGGGCSNLEPLAWYDENSGRETHVVGNKQANAWGLYDMHGNVWEWCCDWYGPYPVGSVTDPTGPKNGSYRVARGGSWNDIARCCRSALRSYDEPGNGNGRLGFRPIVGV